MPYRDQPGSERRSRHLAPPAVALLQLLYPASQLLVPGREPTHDRAVALQGGLGLYRRAHDCRAFVSPTPEASSGSSMNGPSSTSAGSTVLARGLRQTEPFQPSHRFQAFLGGPVPARLAPPSRGFLPRPVLDRS